MPTYDYQCRSCGAITEVVHSMLEQGPTTCERCGGPLRMLVHPAGIIFRGSGFYKNDSRASTSASAGSTATSGSADGGTGTGGAPADAGSADKGSTATPKSEPAAKPTGESN